MCCVQKNSRRNYDSASDQLESCFLCNLSSGLRNLGCFSSESSRRYFFGFF
jgi:hypothetical protein